MPKTKTPAVELPSRITLELKPEPRASRAKASGAAAKAESVKAPRTRWRNFADVTLKEASLGVLGYLRGVTLTLVTDDATGQGSFTLNWTEDVIRYRVKASKTFVFRLTAQKKAVTTIKCPGFFAKCGQTPRVLRKVITTAQSDRIDDFDGKGVGAPQRCG